MWYALAVVAAVGMVIFAFRGPNAMWGGATLGAIAGLVVALFRSIPFAWTTVGKGVVIGALAGIGAELLSLVARRAQHGKSDYPA